MRAASQAQVVPSRRDGSYRWLLLAIALALAVGVRFLHGMEAAGAYKRRGDARFEEPHHGNDEARYLRTCRGIVERGDFGTDVEANPLYPLVVLPALYALAGRDVVRTRLLQGGLLGLATVWLVYRVGRRLGGESVGVLAGFLAALHPPLVVYDTALLSEPLINVASLGALLAILGLRRRPGIGALVGTGVVIGLAALAKPTMLILLPLAMVALWRAARGSRWRSLPRAALVMAAVLTTIAPVTARNYRATGEFILIRANGGQVFLMGNNPTATGRFNYPRGDWARREAEAIAPVEGSPRGKDAARFRLAWEFVRTRPGDFLRLTARKVGLFFSPAEIGNNLSVTYRRQITSLGWPVFPMFGWLLGPALAAPVIVRGRSGRGVWLLYLFVPLHALSTALFVVVSRYRLPTTLCLTVLAAAVAVRVARWARERRWLGATAAAAAALVLTGALHTDLIYRWAVPLVRPKGFVDQSGERTVIRDDAEPLRECFTWLRDPAMCVEKTLVVPEGLLPIQKAWVAVLYRAEQPSRCLIIVNGRPWPVDLSASSGRSGMLQVPPSAIVPGPNVIRVKTVGDSSVAVWVSDRFRFGRSRWQDTSGDWHRRYLDEESPLRRVSTHLVSGEYAIRLHVSRGQTGER